MSQMLSSCYSSLRHGKVKQADQIRKDCDLTCRRADIQQKGNHADILKYINIDTQVTKFDLTEKLQY